MYLCRSITSGEEVVIEIETSGCEGQENEINFLEHVQLILYMNHSKRGDLEIYLISPSGKYYLNSRYIFPGGRRHKYPCFYILPLEFGVNIDMYNHENTDVLC